MSARDAVAQRLEIQRRHNPSMGGPDQRDYRNADDVLDGLAAHGFVVLDLPDAEHIHLTRRADGGWDAVPMEEQTFAPGMWEYVARCFHAHYERLAGDFGYQTRPESAVAWQNVPERNRRLMVATVGHVLRDIRDIRRLWVDAPKGGTDE